MNFSLRLFRVSEVPSVPFRLATFRTAGFLLNASETTPARFAPDRKLRDG
jgi:hypothetical protein